MEILDFRPELGTPPRSGALRLDGVTLQPGRNVLSTAEADKVRKHEYLVQNPGAFYWEPKLNEQPGPQNVEVESESKPVNPTRKRP